MECPDGEARNCVLLRARGGAMKAGNSACRCAPAKRARHGGLSVKIAPDAPMPAVRAYQALLVIEDHVAIVETQPEREDIESGAAMRAN